MKKTGIFYGSTTGTTAGVAHKIANKLGINDTDIHDIASTKPSEVGAYDNLIFGTSTWGSGEFQDDWYDFIAALEMLDLTGKTIALFGVGDETMTDTFCSSVGTLYRRLRNSGARFVGRFDADGYTFHHSDASDGDAMVGLVLDQVNHPDLTDGRVDRWTAQLKKELE